MKIKNKILVIDINYLPIEYKDLSTKEIKKELQEDFKCKVLFIDASRQNIQGSGYMNQPVYFIK
jgi:hypothetical protein